MNAITLAPEVREALGRSSTQVHASLTQGARFLLALSAKEQRTGSAVFRGVPASVKAARRAAGKRAKAARKASRS